MTINEDLNLLSAHSERGGMIHEIRRGYSGVIGVIIQFDLSRVFVFWLTWIFIFPLKTRHLSRASPELLVSCLVPNHQNQKMSCCYHIDGDQVDAEDK